MGRGPDRRRAPSRLGELAAQAETIDRETPVVFYCRVGGRSAMAANAFRRAGYDAYSMTGGLVAWDARGLPLEPDGWACRGALIALACAVLARARRGGAAARQGRRLRRARPTPPPAGRRQRACSSSEQRRARADRARRRGAGAAVPRRDPITRAPTSERGLLSVAFAPDYATSGPLLRLPHRPTSGRGRDPGPRVPRSAATRRRRPGQRPAAAARSRTPTPTTTTAASCSSGPTASSGSAPATAAAATTSSATRRTRRRCSAS